MDHFGRSLCHPENNLKKSIAELAYLWYNGISGGAVSLEGKSSPQGDKEDKEMSEICISSVESKITNLDKEARILRAMVLLEKFYKKTNKRDSKSLLERKDWLDQMFYIGDSLGMAIKDLLQAIEDRKREFLLVQAEPVRQIATNKVCVDKKAVADKNIREEMVQAERVRQIATNKVCVDKKAVADKKTRNVLEEMVQNSFAQIEEERVIQNWDKRGRLISASTNKSRAKCKVCDVVNDRMMIVTFGSAVSDIMCIKCAKSIVKKKYEDMTELEIKIMQNARQSRKNIKRN